MAPRGWAAEVVLALIALLAVAQARELSSDPQGSYRAAYGYVLCEPGVTISPKSTAGVAYAVNKYLAHAARANRALKIRASRHKFHTTTSLVCPDQEYAQPIDGSASGGVRHGGVLAVAILHDNMDKVLSVDAENHRMTVGAGMRINQLLPAATAVNMSVMAGSLPAYAGLTIGGILAAGAHGTGDMTISSPADMVVEVTVVDGKGEIVKVKNPSPEFNALSAGLGLTGIITEVVLQLTPPTNTKLVTRFLSGDETMFEDIEKMLKHAPHILVFWRPDFKMYSAYMMKPVDISVPATDDFMTLLPSFKGRGQMAGMYKGFQTDLFDAGLPMVGGGESFMCPTVAANSVAKTWANKKDGTPVLYTVAPTNNLVASECDDNCAWNGPEFNGTAEDNHFAIEWDQFSDWIADIKSIFEKDLWQDPKLDKSRCLGPGYIWLRFGHPRAEYLHMAYGMKRPVYVQSTWLRSRGSPTAPMRFGWVTDLLEEVTLCKYKGRPHWGKNYLRTFTHPKCPMRPLFPAFDAAAEQAAKADPEKIFEPRVWSHIIKQEPYKPYPRCALNKDCFCTEDAHCPRGMACVASVALPQFNICKPDWKAYEETKKEYTGWGIEEMLGRWQETENVMDNSDRVAHVKVVGVRSRRRA